MITMAKSSATLERLAEQNTRVDHFVRCVGLSGQRDKVGVELDCGKLLAEIVARPWRIKCPRCNHVNDG